MNAIAQASAAPVTGPKLDNRRVLAGIVDLAIVTLGAVVILFAGDALSGDRSEVQGALGAVILGWALYYYFALESGDGQTVGKKLMKLRVVKADGSPAEMGEIAVRTILRVVDGAGAYIVGLIVMLATGQRRQRLGDIAAGTIVIDASTPSFVPAAATPAAEHAELADAEGYEADEDMEDIDEADAPYAEPAATITLPARPAPPSTLADLADPEPEPEPESETDPEPAPEPDPEPDPDPAPEFGVAPELRAEHGIEAPPLHGEEEPLVEEPLVAEPLVEEPLVEELVVEEPVAAEESLPPMTSPSLEELARDVEAAQAEPVVFDAEPVEEEGPVTVRSVETVSAIDLIMGGSEEGSEESSQDGEDTASQ